MKMGGSSFVLTFTGGMVLIGFIFTIAGAIIHPVFYWVLVGITVTAIWAVYLGAQVIVRRRRAR